MRLWKAIREDLAKPEAPYERDFFLIVIAPVILLISVMVDPGTTWDVIALLPAVAACVIRGAGIRLPAEVFAALVIIPVTFVIGRDGDLEVAMFLPVMVVLYTSASLNSVIRAGTILVAAALSPLLVTAVLVPDAGIGWVPWSAASVFVFVLGITLRKQEVLIGELEAAREELARQAVGEERRRMARELHDISGHTLAAMLLHVTGARHVLERGDPDEARNALVEAEEVGRDSLDQVRLVVAALRADETGTDRSLTGIGDLDELVETYRRAGLEVEAEIDPAGLELSEAVGVSLYRIAQEALTNVARHAPGNSATLTLSRSDDALVLSIADRGGVPEGMGANGPGFGLIGMEERAKALGGRCEAGPHADGWLVTATLPIAGIAVS